MQIVGFKQELVLYCTAIKMKVKMKKMKARSKCLNSLNIRKPKFQVYYLCYVTACTAFHMASASFGKKMVLLFENSGTLSSC